MIPDRGTPIYNISEWDEVRVRHQTAHVFNWRNANSRTWERAIVENVRGIH